MNSAGEAFFQNNFARARRLHEHFEDSDLRQFEWRWLQKAMTPPSLAGEIEVPYGVASVRFSPLGDRVAFGLRNGNVFVFDWKKKSGQSYGSSDLFWASNPVAFLDEHQVVYCEANRILRIHLLTRATALVGDHPGDVVQLAASGNLILSACRDGKVRLWKTDTATPLRDFQLKAGWNSVALSPNGDFLAAGDGDGVIWVWKSDGLDEPLVKIRGHLWVSTLSFSPSAELLASGGSDGTMKVWSRQEKAEIFTWGHSDRLLSVHFAASGDRLLACDRAGAVTLWAVNPHETKDRQFVKTATIRRQSSGTYVALSPRGDIAAVGGFDRRAMLWDLTKLEQDESTLFAGRRISNVQFLSGTRLLVVAHDDLPSLGHADLPPVDATVVVWDCEKRQPVRELAKDSCRSMVTSSKGMIAIGTNEEKVVLWDTKDSFSLSAPQELVGYPGPLAFSPDGEILAAASLDGHVRLWNVKERRVEGRTLVSPVAELAALSISPSKSKLAVGANGGQVAVLNLLSGAVDRTCSGHWSRVSSLSFSPDDRWLASASWDRSIRLWDMRTRRDEGYSLDGHNLWVSSVLFSPDSRTIFSASGDRTIRIWDVGTRQMRFTLRDHEAPLHGLDLSSDGNLLVAGGHDGQVRFWKASE